MSHPDLNRLLNSIIPFAQQMLAKHGEFYPFGSSIDNNGKIVMDSIYDGNEHPLSQELIDLLTQTYYQSAVREDIIAAAICYDGRTTYPGQKQKVDTICIGLEHKTGEAVDIIIPYHKGLFRKIRYDEIIGFIRVPRFFIHE